MSKSYLKAGLCLCSIFAVLVWLLVCTVNAQNDITANKDISIDQAKDKIKEFVGKKDIEIKYKATESLPHGKIYMMYADDGIYYVNTETGNVESAYFKNKMNNSNDVKLSIDDAEKTALKYIEGHYKNYGSIKNNMIVDRAELLDHGSAGKEYIITLAETINGTITANVSSVLINPYNGEVIAYMGMQRPLTIDVNPKIAKVEAETIAASQYKKLADAKCESQLRVVYTEDGAQRLAWFIEVTGKAIDKKGYGGYVVIDAENGEVIYK